MAAGSGRQTRQQRTYRGSFILRRLDGGRPPLLFPFLSGGQARGRGALFNNRADPSPLCAARQKAPRALFFKLSDAVSARAPMLLFLCTVGIPRRGSACVGGGGGGEKKRIVPKRCQEGAISGLFRAVLMNPGFCVRSHPRGLSRKSARGCKVRGIQPQKEKQRNNRKGENAWMAGKVGEALRAFQWHFRFLRRRYAVDGILVLRAARAHPRLDEWLSRNFVMPSVGYT